ncbi:Selenocysteine lyase/Cysteine desulfurase [Amycolatopsis marina]|uniref:Selenocysteine lyase/Cysteine desulfurase n=1 Tax=Amycolatopsis marina TaxID=490629 RepID=A0A1I0ZMK4_9PSEU|nr:aminotransferase class V-fold PLP-dependent enzyme [Amycolatopsis marina]SFB25608.1 Selenocysteine lyase/Cysteine desulfurase [Amycolatopsis marina]
MSSTVSSLQLEPALPAVAGADVAVPLANGSQVPYANFDYAASAPCLLAVKDALDAALPLYASVHRGAGHLSRMTTRAYENARQTVRRFAAARPDDSVIFTRNTTDSMNLLASCVPLGTTVVVFESEHHANLLPWLHRHFVVRLPMPRSPEDAVATAADVLAPGGLLVVTAASNVTGELWPIDELAAAAHARGARIAVDAAQLAPHRPLDMSNVDYLAFSGHKLYAPFGSGVLIGRGDWLRDADPYLRGGGASKTVGSGTVIWASAPEERHEAGSPNVLGALAISAACAALDAAGRPALAAAEERLFAHLRSGLSSVPGLRELSLWGPDSPRVGIVSFVIEGWDPHSLAQTLSDSYGIGVRDGKMCAHNLVRQLLGGTDGSIVRASIGLGTTRAHIDRLVTALAELTTVRAAA